MSSRRKLIANLIEGMPGAPFQELVEDYLELRHPEFQSINPAGSNEIEQKTTVGHPDTLFWTIDGNPVFVEATVKKKGVLNKFKKDIIKCSRLKDELGLAKSPVLYLCYGRKFKPKQDKELTDYGSSLGIIIVLVGLTKIAMDIELRFPELARNYFHLAHDTGQTMSIQEFIAKHGTKTNRLTTPLNNTLVGGKERVDDLKKGMNGNEVVMVSGPQGVGKTKIVIETLRQRELHDRRRARIIISNPGVSIWEDLHYVLQQEQPVDLFIDDANYQITNLSNILFFASKYPEKGLRIVMTVRSIAKADLNRVFEKFKLQAHEIEFSSYTDEEISAIVSSSPFNINQHEALRYIHRVAKGSAREAIMAAKVVQDNDYDFQNSSVSHLYEAYYSKYLADFSVLKKPRWLKILGYLSFHQAVDLSSRSKPHLKKDLKELGISYKKFVKTLSKLSERELVDIEFDVVKVTDQNLSIYFIYLAFLKTKILDFSVLFQQNFPDNRRRLRSVCKELKDDFGKVDVLYRVGQAIEDIEWRLDGGDKLKFFETFWFLLEDKLLSWATRQVFQLEEVNSPTFAKIGDRQKSHYEQNDKLLELLSNLFEYKGERLISALRISSCYIKRRPDLLGELVSNIRSALNFKSGDDKNGYARQEGICRYMLAGLKAGSELHQRLFLEIVPGFLQGESSVFQLHAEVKRKDQESSFLREELWDGLDQLFDDYSSELLGVLSIMGGRYGRVTIYTYEIDRECLFRIFHNNLSPVVLRHSIIVVRTCDWLKRRGINNDQLENLKKAFSTEEYEIFADLSYDYRAYSDRKGDVDESIESFDKWKEGVLRKGYVFTQVSDFQRFMRVLVEILEVEGTNNFMLSKSLSIVFLENLKVDSVKAINFLKEFITQTAGGVTPLRSVIHYIVKHQPLRDDFMKFMISYQPQLNIQHWLVEAFDTIAEQNLTEEFYTYFNIFICSVQKRCFISIDTLESFSSSRTDFDEWLKILNIRALNDNSFQIHFGGLRSLSSQFIAKHFNVLQDTYLIHANRDEHFDFSHDLLEEILKSDSAFLVRLVKALYSEDNLYHRHHRDNKLGLIWKFPQADKIVRECIDFVLENHPYTDYDSSPTSAFFEEIPDDKGKDARKFALRHIKDNALEVSHVNAMLATIRTRMSDIYEEAVAHYVQSSPSIEDFRKVKWVSSGGVYSGNTIIGHVHAGNWREFGKLIRDVAGTVDTTEMMLYVDEQVRINEMWATSELRRQFISGHW